MTHFRSCSVVESKDSSNQCSYTHRILGRHHGRVVISHITAYDQGQSPWCPPSYFEMLLGCGQGLVSAQSVLNDYWKVGSLSTAGLYGSMPACT